MEIKTKFNLGDKIWAVINSKATEIEVTAISITANGISYGDSQYNMHRESECFFSKPELIEYIASE